MEEGIIKGSPLRYNVGTQNKFISDVNRTMINPLMNETEERVNGLFEEFAAGLLLFPALNTRSRKILSEIEKKYGVIFKIQAERIGKKYIENIRNFSKSSVKRNLKILSFGRTTAFKENKGNIEAITKTSDIGIESLLLSMGAYYLDKVGKQVDQAVISKNKAGVKDYLINQRGITHRKVKNDSKDFYRQSFNAFNGDYLESNNLDKWQWVHTHRAHEQNPYHMYHLNGLVFEYGAPPPVIDQRTGTTGYPGDWYGCRCIKLPVVTY